MAEPSDADRIIAAHRDEARRTRHAVVGTLLGIFVGLPLLGLIGWGIVAAIHAGSGPATSGSTVVACASTVPTDGATVDLGACPLSGPGLTDESQCSAFNTAEGVAMLPDRTNPTVAYESQVGVTNTSAFATYCAVHPNSTLMAAKDYAATIPTG